MVPKTNEGVKKKVGLNLPTEAENIEPIRITYG